MKFLIACLSFACLTVSVFAQSYDDELAKLSASLGSSLERAELKTVAFGGFKNLDGKDTGLGKLLIEDLSVDLVNQNKGASVVDRANLGRLMDEYKLTEEGLIAPENAKKLKLAGIDAIILGTVIPFDNSYRIDLKAIATDSAKVVAATRGTVTKTETLDSLAGMAKLQTKPEAESVSASSDASSEQPPKQRSFKVDYLTFDIKSITFYKQSGKVEVIYTVTNTSMGRPCLFAYHLIGKNPPHADYFGYQQPPSGGFEIQSGATDDQEHRYASVLPFDPLATPTLEPGVPTTFKLDFKMIAANGEKIQIPASFSFWFTYYSATPGNNAGRFSLSDYAFDEMK